MMRSISVAAALAASAALTPIVAQAAATHMIIGTVVHVSTNNIKIKDAKTGKVMAFVLVPHFKKVFSKDGKTTQQMSALTPGTPVTIYYTETLGVRHADRILINGSVKTLKG